MLIASPNLSLDRVIGLDRLDPGHIHRVRYVDVRLGGGGANAARVAALLGHPAVLVTMVPQREGPLVQSLERQGVTVEAVSSAGEFRIATIVREDIGRMSVLTEPGAAVTPRDWEAFVRRVQARLPKDQALLCSGSLPPGAPADGYSYLAREARHSGATCVVDVAGAALEATVDGREGLVVPNLAEAEGVLHGPRPQPVHGEDDPPERALAAANELIRRGAPKAVVTAGKAGAAYAEEGPRGRSGWIQAPKVAAHSLIGAGDAFACGLTLRLEAGAPLDDAVGWATTVAAAHVESQTGQLDPKRIKKLAPRLHAAASEA